MLSVDEKLSIREIIAKYAVTPEGIKKEDTLDQLRELKKISVAKRYRIGLTGQKAKEPEKSRLRIEWKVETTKIKELNKKIEKLTNPQ